MLRFDKLLPAARVIWAKSGNGVGHGLLTHMLDVAAVAAVILEREHWAPSNGFIRDTELPPEAAHGWIIALVGLHDFGKAIPGFQAKWPDGRQRDEAAGLTFGSCFEHEVDHAAASAGLLRAFLATKTDAAVWVLAALQAISAHHGYNYLSRDIRNARPMSSPIWDTARREIFDTYWATLEPRGAPNPEGLSLAEVAWLAGLTSVADWIASNPDWFPLGERAETLKGHFAAAKTLGERALDKIGWPRCRPLLKGDVVGTDALIARIMGDHEVRARPLQAAADKLLANVVRPTLIIVEAPMGEGKTELALLAHLRLQAANQHRGLYIALPTQATGNAIFDRTLRFLHAFADNQTLDIQIAHGGAMLDERVARLRGIYGETGDNIGSSTWFSQHRRALISPYGVGTIDQALFATLNIKHHFVRLWGLANRVVVLDEVHAYDTYTSGLIGSLLHWLKALNCSVVLMSATLPEKRRRDLLAAWGVNSSDVPSLAYPRLLVASNESVRGETVAARPLPPIDVSGIAENLETIAGYALRQLSLGGCGAIIVNTVERAQQLYSLLRAQVPSECHLMLFHARYPANERSAREKEVLECFGRDGHRPPRVLLIATQVVEQSLDIDFDFLVSDLAPIDLLLQRAGRLHRHQRQRPQAHRVARLIVAGLIQGRFPELTETKWKYVYDPYILCRTWALTADESIWQLPQDIDRLVQRVYNDNIDLPDGLSAIDRQRIEEGAYGEYLANVQQDALYALHAAIDADAEPQNAYADKPRGNEDGDGLGIRNRTRLGDEGIAVVPVHVSADGWRLNKDHVAFDPRTPVSDDLARTIYGRQLKVNRKAVVAKLIKDDTPPCFAEHPLLRHLKPLPLVDDSTQAGGYLLRLDAVLGLVYETISTPDRSPVKDTA